MTRGRSGYPITKLMSPEVGKWVTVNVNGNTHHEARILISPYTMRQFENLLSHLTDKLKPPFGAVWRLFTENGVEIKDLDDIKGGHTYIASGRAKPMFPLRMGVKGGRGRRADGRERELRSHSAVGSLGGGRVQSASVGGGMGVADAASAASDTNVKKLTTVPGSPAGQQPRPSRPAPAPRRGKARARADELTDSVGRVWDGHLHTQQQTHYEQAIPCTKRKKSASKIHHAEYFESDEVIRRIDNLCIQSPTRGSHQTNMS